MPLLDIKSRAQKYIAALDGKQAGQLSRAILKLGARPAPADPADSAELSGFTPLRRQDVGEYRLVYWHDEEVDIVRIVLVGKRNGDEVYEELKRFFEGKKVTLERLINRLR